MRQYRCFRASRMLIWVTTILFFLLQFDTLVSQPSADTRGLITIQALDKSGTKKDIQLYSGYYALVVGCGDYHAGWPRLPNPVKDARDVASALEKVGCEVNLLEDPDWKTLRRALNELIIGPGRDEEKAILFWFSGHGHTLKESGGRELGYIVPVDAPNPDRDEIGFMEHAISMRQVETLARRIRSRHTLMLFDSCFSGAIFQAVRSKPSAHIEEKVRKPVRQFITAGNQDEQVPDESMFKAVFVQSVQECFADRNSDGYLTGMELGDYLQEQVINYSRGAQHPQFGKINDPALDKGDFVFYLGRSETAGDAPAPESRASDSNGRLFVRTTPADAMIRILNIATPFNQGMELSPGDYQIEVSATGHETAARWVNIASEEDQRIDFRLSVNKVDQMPPASARRPSVRKNNQVTNDLGMVFVKIKPGTFTMGPASRKKGAHPVTLTQAYFIQTTEVTQGQWKQVMGNNPSEFKACGDDCPVERVSWNDAQQFIRKLNQMPSGGQYRLPTEAEWEYAARAKTRTPFSFGGCLSTDNANFNGLHPMQGCPKGEYRKKTVAVGSFPSNPWGLHDIHGNVWEWCQDRYGAYPTDPVRDPQGPSTGASRVSRGGGWNNMAKVCRLVDRRRARPGSRFNNLGLRLVRVP